MEGRVDAGQPEHLFFRKVDGHAKAKFTLLQLRALLDFQMVISHHYLLLGIPRAHHEV